MHLVSQGDTKAFNKLFKTYCNKIYSIGYYLTKSELIAEEIVQEVFIKVWENRKKLTDINFFNSWLRVVTKNTCYNYLRKKATEVLAISTMSENHVVALPEPTPQEITEFREFERCLEAAIQKLPTQQQKVFRLKKFSGKKVCEIAEELDISTHTVKEYLKIAQKSVKTNLKAEITLAALIFFMG